MTKYYNNFVVYISFYNVFYRVSPIKISNLNSKCNNCYIKQQFYFNQQTPPQKVSPDNLKKQNKINSF